MTSLIEEGLQLALARTTRTKTQRVMPPVSKATGGPMPGMDVTDFSALQETEDLEYLQRMKRLK